MRRPDRRGQMEMLGLAIIVVIILFGLMLALRFFYFRQETNPAQAALDVQLGANLLDTMLEMTTGCKNVPLITLLQECARGSGLACQNVPDLSGKIVVKGGTACDHATSTIQYVLNQTLDTWGRKYEFGIVGPAPLSSIKMKQPKEGCPEGSQAITRPRPIGPGVTATFTLKLCQ